MDLEEAVGCFLAGYFSTCKRSQKTQTAYKMDLGQFQTFIGKNSALEQIPSDSLEKWALELRSKEYASRSIRRKFATLRVFFGYWIRKGDLNASPLWRVRLDLGREHQLPRSLMAADAKRLLEKAWSGVVMHQSLISRPSDSRFLALRNLTAVEILFATGMRVGELVSLTLPDWREDETSFLVSGKGNRERLAVLPDERSIMVVKNYLIHRSAMDLNHNSLLVNAAGGRLSTQGVARALGRLAQDAEIAIRVTPHMMRHTVATLLLRNGADIRVVQEVLGHASITMTQRYTHVSKEHLRSTLHAYHPNHHLNIVPTPRPPA